MSQLTVIMKQGLFDRGGFVLNISSFLSFLSIREELFFLIFTFSLPNADADAYINIIICFKYRNLRYSLNFIWKCAEKVLLIYYDRS